MKFSKSRLDDESHETVRAYRAQRAVLYRMQAMKLKRDLQRLAWR